MIKGFIVGFLLAIVVLCGGVVYYFTSGAAPAATADRPMPFEKKLANMALDAHIKAQNVGEPPIAADEPNLTAAVEIYKANCSECHGLPDHDPSPYEKDMFPEPTPLFRGKGVTDDPPSESYWKVANGIRLSGMPSFKTQLTNTQMWQVAQLVAHANELPDSVKSKLAADDESADAPTAPSDEKTGKGK